jgi:CRP-like cAMP-binding protein
MTQLTRPLLDLTNHFLASLPDEELTLLSPNLERISLKLGDVVYESGEKMEFAYFPINAIVSLLYVMENGSTSEIGIVGNDGVVGHPLVMGGSRTAGRAIIQGAGSVFRVPAEDFKSSFALGGVFQHRVLQFTQALLTQISLTAVCNRLHSIEHQLCRWLLLSHDRLNSDLLIVTHDLVADILGVRREGVTLAIQKLSKKDLIKNVRGRITIIDRKGLEKAVCECYAVVNDEYERLLGRELYRRE